MVACERSLARLKSDRLDCYLLHWHGGHPLEDTIWGFDQLQREGKILSWGVSNFDVPDLNEVRKISGKGHPAIRRTIIWERARSSPPRSSGARRMALRSSPIAHSVIKAAFLARAPPGAGC